MRKGFEYKSFIWKVISDNTGLKKRKRVQEGRFVHLDVLSSGLPCRQLGLSSTGHLWETV